MYKEIINNTKEIYDQSDKSEEYLSALENVLDTYSKIGEIINKFKSIYKKEGFFTNEDLITPLMANKVTILQNKMFIENKRINAYDKLKKSYNTDTVKELIDENRAGKSLFKNDLYEYGKDLLLSNDIVKLSQYISLLNSISIGFDEVRPDQKSCVTYSYLETSHNDTYTYFGENTEIDPSRIYINLCPFLNDEEINYEIKNRIDEIINEYYSNEKDNINKK